VSESINCGWRSLDSEAVESSSLSLESVDDVEGGDGLALGVLGVGDGVSDDVYRRGGESVNKVVSGNEEEREREGGAHSQGRS
jgi:hypothetical protein